MGKYKSRIELKIIAGIKHRQCIGVDDNNCQNWFPHNPRTSRCKICQATWKKAWDRANRARKGNLPVESKMNIERELKGLGKPMSKKALYKGCNAIQKLALETGDVQLLLKENSSK